MQYDKSRPKQKQINKADQTKEKLHVDSGFVPDLLFQNDRVNPVHDCAESGHGVAEGNLGGAFVRKPAVAAVVCRGGFRCR
jgi:hypothetical protein